MRTILEIPDDLFRQAKASAARRGESLEDFVTAALEAHLKGRAGEASPRRSEIIKAALEEYLKLRAGEASDLQGWRSVFGKARREEVEAVDAVIAKELGRINPDGWR